MGSKRTRHRASFSEGALQRIFDDSRRSDGRRPKLFEPREAGRVLAQSFTSVLGRTEQAIEASKFAAADEGNLALCRIINVLLSKCVRQAVNRQCYPQNTACIPLVEILSSLNLSKVEHFSKVSPIIVFGHDNNYELSLSSRTRLLFLAVRGRVP
jgi:hypothetical protein